MIKSLELLPCGNAPKGGDDYFVRNLYKIAKKPKLYNFIDGLNLIIGPNGCGKSTLLNIIAGKMSINHPDQCYQLPCRSTEFLGFMDKVSEKKSYEEYLKREYICGTGYHIDVNIEYENVLTYYLNKKCFDAKKAFSCAIAFGRTGSLAYKDGFEAMANSMITLSNGQVSVNKLMTFLNNSSSKAKFSKEYLTSLSSSYLNDTSIDLMIDWQNRHHSENSKPTLLIDEIDEGMDLVNQIIYFKTLLPKLLEKYQVIMVSHSAYILKFLNDKSVNLISFFNKEDLKLIKHAY